MKYLFSHWAGISKRLKVASNRLYLFDIDGTLAPIAKTPEDAHIDESLRQLVYTLSTRPRTTVGIISGRQIENAMDMVGLRQLIYAGNHGIEMRFNGVQRIQPQEKSRVVALKRLYRKAKKELSIVPGALVEGKGLTMSLHYRLVDKKNKPMFDRIIQKKIFPLLKMGDFLSRKGKKVIEVVPNGHWDKGSVVKMLMKHSKKPITVYIGDDVTDENAFGVLDHDGVSIRVGRKKKSKAAYYLKSQYEVKNLLKRLVKI
jgi:trehalose 6-phosphate phosphatase